MGGLITELPDEINLGSLNESEFKRLCASILEKLGYGSQEHIEGYKGKGEDLTLTSAGSLVMVECRHCPGRTVGRPIVQQLHSAAVSSHAKIAMVITTGKFAETAREYAKEASTPNLEIRLIDLPILKDMAARANIDLVGGAHGRSVWMHKVSDDESFALSFGECLNNRYTSHPAKPSEMLKILDREVELVSAYEVSYEVDATFRTTVGVVHHESELNGVLLLNGTKGFVMKDEIGEFYRQFAPIQYSNEAVEQICPVVVPFRVDEMSAKKEAVREIIARHTKRVTYVGGNNRMYDKMCQPKEKDVTITSMRQVYLPISTTTYQIGDKEHKQTHMDHPSGGVKLLNNEVSRCSVCGGEIKGKKPQLCNSCGAITHPKGFLSSHGVVCKDCGFTLCRTCATFRRRVILKAPFCKKCAERRMNQKAKKDTPATRPPTKRTRKTVTHKTTQRTVSDSNRVPYRRNRGTRP